MPPDIATSGVLFVQSPHDAHILALCLNSAVTSVLLPLSLCPVLFARDGDPSIRCKIVP